MTTHNKQPVRASFAAFVGTTIEWYDFYIYGFASALIFNKLFFDTGSDFVNTMASFTTFAVGLLVRPVGGIIFGHMGDKIGRKKSLIITLFLMGVATVGVGCLPTYAQVGVLAPILLVLLRIVQGLAVGGEWGGAVLIAAEHAPTGRRAFFASFAQLGSPAGLIIATLAFKLISNMDEADLLSFGWRIPFCSSALLLVVGFLVRKGVSESPEFIENQQHQEHQEQAPVKEVITKIPGLVLLAIGANVLGIAGFYFTNTFMLAYTTLYLHINQQTILNALLVVSIIQFFNTPISAWLAEKVGVHKFLVTTAALCLVSPYLMFVLVATAQVVWMTIGIAITVIFMSAYYAVIAGYISSLFPTRLRYTAISIAYQFCGAVAGGLTPLIATGFAEYFSGQWLPLAGLYSLASVVTLVCINKLSHHNYQIH